MRLYPMCYSFSGDLWASDSYTCFLTMFEIESFTHLVEMVSPEVMFAIGGFGMNLLVLPTLLDSNAAVPRTQSVMSAIVLLICFSIPYYWIGFYLPSLANLIGFILWSAVALYRHPNQTTTKSNSSTQSSSNSNPHPAD